MTCARLARSALRETLVLVVGLGLGFGLLAGCSDQSAGPLPGPTVSSTTGTATTSSAPCPARPISSGVAASRVIVAISAPATAASGATLAVDTDIVVLSDGPAVVLRSRASSLEVLRGTTVVARTAGSGADVPLSLRAGTSPSAQTVPAAVALVGCQGGPLPAGDYRVRAVVGYDLAAEAGATADPSPGYVLVSDPPVDVTVR